VIGGIWLVGTGAKAAGFVGHPLVHPMRQEPRRDAYIVVEVRRANTAVRL
jgi:hypothetical protein